MRGHDVRDIQTRIRRNSKAFTANVLSARQPTPNYTLRSLYMQLERREHFRSTKAAQFVGRRLQQDLNRIQRLVESLDEGDGRPRSIMWPEEASLEDTVSEIISGGNAIESWETDDNERGRPSASTALAIAASGSDEEINGEQHEGLGPAGGLREEWDMMTSEEKVSCFVVIHGLKVIRTYDKRAPTARLCERAYGIRHIAPSLYDPLELSIVVAPLPTGCFFSIFAACVSLERLISSNGCVGSTTSQPRTEIHSYIK